MAILIDIWIDCGKETFMIIYVELNVDVSSFHTIFESHQVQRTASPL